MKKIILAAILGLCFTTVFSQALLDHAVGDGRVDSVWKAFELPHPYSGKDVIIGVTDWGFDYTHPVFYDTTMTHYRVLRAWDQYKTSGPAPDGFDYGTEYVGPEELLTALCDTINTYDYGYHGTHCASIAAGAGAGTKYRGVAYDANLLFCTIHLEDVQTVIDAWRWMYNVAQEEGKRLVISMSWGVYYIDNIDGTGTLANEIKRLSDLGVLFVTSAGNNGDYNFHIGHDFNQPNDTIRTQVTFPGNNGHLWGTSISMVNSANSPFSFSFNLMNNQFQTLAKIPFVNTATSNGYVDSYLVVGTDTIPYNYDIQSCNEYNHRPTVRLRIRTTGYKVGLAITAPSGSFHAWNVAELSKSYGNWGGDFVAPSAHPEWIAGDSHYGLGIPANVDEVISVAAHSSRFIAPAGNWAGGQITNFSSFGPGFHTGLKPEVSAPGQNIVSAISSYTNTFTDMYKKTITFNGRNYKFAALSGTSMSCPFVAGVAALILQANPYLSVTQIREIITETAYNDEFTAEAGQIRFGYGKVNAYQAVLRALNTVGVQQHVTSHQSSYTIFPNPTSGNCYITVQSNASQIRCNIFDLTGRMVGNEMLVPGVNNLTLQNFTPGCYIIRLNDGIKTVSKKLIVQ